LAYFSKSDWANSTFNAAGVDLAVHGALLDFEGLLGLDDGQLRLLDGDLLLVDGVLSGGGVQFDEEVAFLHGAALRHDEDDARDALHFATDALLVHRFQGAALDDGDEEVAPFDFIRSKHLRRPVAGIEKDNRQHGQSDREGAEQPRALTNPSKKGLEKGGSGHRRKVWGQWLGTSINRRVLDCGSALLSRQRPG
jgi:hypothetical protein